MNQKKVPVALRFMTYLAWALLLAVPGTMLYYLALVLLTVLRWALIEPTLWLNRFANDLFFERILWPQDAKHTSEAEAVSQIRAWHYALGVTPPADYLPLSHDFDRGDEDAS